MLELIKSMVRKLQESTNRFKLTHPMMNMAYSNLKLCSVLKLFVSLQVKYPLVTGLYLDENSKF